jgi:adenine phosphoribosyltransferase
MADLETALKSKIRSIPDYPKKGILFRDITPLLKDPVSFRACIDALAAQFSDASVDHVAGIEARGFILGGALAEKLGAGFVPIRKKGKLPSRKISIDYELEYGKETIEVHEDAVEKGSRVLIADDLLATGGTAEASGRLMQKIGADIVGYAFLVELVGLKGRDRLGAVRVVSLVKY